MSAIDENNLSASFSSSRSKSLDSSEGLTLSGTSETEGKHSTTGSSSSRSKGSFSDSPGSYPTNEFMLKTLGCLEKLHGQGEGPLDVINVIDVAQQEDNLPFVADGEDVLILITMQGIQVTSITMRHVVVRIPLHEVERLVTFDDGICGNTLLVIKTVQLNDKRVKESTYSLYVYQCPTKEIGQKITQCFSHILAKVLSSASTNEIKEERSI